MSAMNETRLAPNLSPDDAQIIDELCDRFEAAWKSGERPKIETHVETVAEEMRPRVLRQLLLLDWECRQRAGEQPTVADYRERFAKHAALVNEVFGTGRESTNVTPTWSGDYEQLTDWTDSAAAPTKGPDPTPPLAAADRYDLLEEIGHGGVGIIFRCRDRELGRDLAIKVLRPEHRNKPDASRRLLHEASISSQLQHPNIVPIYDRGWFTDRRPFFTMKLVQGQTLAALLRQRQRPEQDLSRFLTIFEQICQAVAYAHARGVIHRDLKPANVMVGAFGEVQVMDWGFAKVNLEIPNSTGEWATPATTAAVPSDPRLVMSQTGWMMGTPPYMPPEQAQARRDLIDCRADVFALGAILCEILTGQPPYTGANAADVFRAAAQGALAAAFARLAACGADPALESLCRRCLAVDREERPADAGIVAGEITAFLENVQARSRHAEMARATAEARAETAVAQARAERRSRRLVLLLAAVLLCGSIVLAWQFSVATQAQQAAIAAASAERSARQSADARAAETDTVLEFVQKRILAVARPKGKGGGLGVAVTLRQALEAALPDIEKRFVEQPLIEARLRMTLGMTFLNLGEPRIAETQLSRALSLYRATFGDESPDTLRCMNNLATTLDLLGRPTEALTLYEKASDGLARQLGPRHADTLGCLNNLAREYFKLRRYEDARRLFQSIVEEMRKTLGPEADVTLTAMDNLASTYSALKQFPGAVELKNQVLGIRRKKYSSDHADTLVAMSSLATVYSAMGRNEEAVRLCEEVLERRTKVLSRDHEQTIVSMTNLAVGYANLGRHADALALRQEALALQNKKFNADHPETLTNLWGIADCLVNLKRGDEAVPIIDDCVARAAGKPVDPELIPDAMQLRMRHFERINDAAGCRDTALRWEKLNRRDAASYVQAARFRAIAAAVQRSSAGTAGDQRLGDNDAERAIAWLQKASAAGSPNAVQWKDDSAFSALRERADFQKLVAGGTKR